MTGARADRVVMAAGTLAAMCVTAVILWMVADLWRTGAAALSPAFILEPARGDGRTGGILTVLVSTALIVATCLAVAVPLGLGCAVALTELLPADSRGAALLGYSLDVLSGVPSIVFGLFGYQFFAITLGMGFSILAGGLTLACMVLPLMVRITEQALSRVPASYRDVGLALSLSQTGMLFRVRVPAAAPGIAAAIILSTGRALAETAALLFTAGYVLRMPGSLLDSGRSLSVHIYDLAMHQPGGTDRAAATALVLVALLITINFLVRYLFTTAAEERYAG